MKYNQQAFDAAVRHYEKQLGKLTSKTVFVEGNIDPAAFFSIAPLSRAVHNLGGDIHIVFSTNNTNKILHDVWDCYTALKQGKNSDATQALQRFIVLVEKKAKGKFAPLFNRPEVVLYTSSHGFLGTLSLPYSPAWFVPYRENDLKKTCRAVWKNVFALRKEKISITFDVIPTTKELNVPLEDYLDSYVIAWQMAISAKTKATSMTLASSSNRFSQLVWAERVSDLKATLIGCELDKNIPEPIFAAFKRLSQTLRLHRLTIPSATFGIYGRGYGGKHLFGELIGYPTLNQKSRWQSPGMMIYKFGWYPQTEHESRPPLARIGFTETIPLDVFIETCAIDYKKMRSRNQKLYDLFQGCDYVGVEGQPVGNYRTQCKVYLQKKDSTFREPRKADSDCRHVIDPVVFAKTGKKVGMMANIPSGECFMTPARLVGRIVGDVVITIEESYMINPKRPLVIDATANKYFIIDGEPDLLQRFTEKKKECWTLLLEQEKNKNVPASITSLEKRNFNKIGEFAINTNPHAKLCRYLIVNEKIAGMIHVALGSGFEPETSTNYHSDIVIDAPQQKMNIFVVKNAKKHWVIKNGKLII